MRYPDRLQKHVIPKKHLYKSAKILENFVNILLQSHVIYGKFNI